MRGTRVVLVKDKTRLICPEQLWDLLCTACATKPQQIHIEQAASLRDEGDGAVSGVNVGHPLVTDGDCGVVILYRDEWRRGSS